MNKDKAIQLLERLQDPEPYEPQITSEAFEALQMAIDALSADGDTISRKAAIGVLHEALDRVDQIADVPFGVYQNYRDKMNELPPAPPERIKGHWIKISPANIYECSECGAEMGVTE